MYKLPDESLALPVTQDSQPVAETEPGEGGIGEQAWRLIMATREVNGEEYDNVISLDSAVGVSREEELFADSDLTKFVGASASKIMSYCYDRNLVDTLTSSESAAFTNNILADIGGTKFGSRSSISKLLSLLRIQNAVAGELQDMLKPRLASILMQTVLNIEETNIYQGSIWPAGATKTISCWDGEVYVRIANKESRLLNIANPVQSEKSDRHKPPAGLHSNEAWWMNDILSVFENLSITYGFVKVDAGCLSDQDKKVYIDRGWKVCVNEPRSFTFDSSWLVRTWSPYYTPDL